MQFLTEASAELVNRPSDEHFGSQVEILEAAKAARAAGRELATSTRQLIVASDSGCGGTGGGFRLQIGSDVPALKLSNYSASQLCRLAGAPPSLVFERLKPETARRVLNESIHRLEPADVLALWQDNGTPILRAITSTGYRRVWDADLLEEVDRWLIPAGFEPARPTKNTNEQRDNIMGNNKPALFRGDRDSFCFYMTPDRSQIGPGDRQQRRGVFIYNSEVGARSFGLTRFLFDDVCANFLVWGAAAVRKIRMVHRGRTGRDIMRRFREELRELQPEVMAAELAMLNRAAETMFAHPSHLEKGVEKIRRFGVSKAVAEEVVNARRWAENDGAGDVDSHLRWAYGLSSLAKQERNADSMVALATVAGDIVAAAGSA